MSLLSLCQNLHFTVGLTVLDCIINQELLPQLDSGQACLIPITDVQHS